VLSATLLTGNENRLFHPRRGTMVGLVILLTICFAASPSFANVVLFPQIPTLVQYGVVSVGPSASIMMNTGPNMTRALVGDGSTVSSSGGNQGSISGGVDVAAPVTGCGPNPATNPTCFSGLQNPPTNNVVPASVGVNAFNEAATLSSFALGLMATQPDIVSLPNGTITGNGMTNVINVTGNSNNPTLTLQGTENDFFVFNLFGNFSENKMMTLIGVDPAHILWNFVGTGTGNRLSTSGGSLLFGTFLSTVPGVNFNTDNLPLGGALWNTGGMITWVSGSMLNAAPFNPAVIPEPGTLATMMLGPGLIALSAALRRKKGASR
jgi:hypothetical protein